LPPHVWSNNADSKVPEYIALSNRVRAALCFQLPSDIIPGHKTFEHKLVKFEDQDIAEDEVSDVDSDEEPGRNDEDGDASGGEE
jgi:hypothetical protein